MFILMTSLYSWEDWAFGKLNDLPPSWEWIVSRSPCPHWQHHRLALFSSPKSSPVLLARCWSANVTSFAFLKLCSVWGGNPYFLYSRFILPWGFAHNGKWAWTKALSVTTASPGFCCHGGYSDQSLLWFHILQNLQLKCVWLAQHHPYKSYKLSL